MKIVISIFIILRQPGICNFYLYTVETTWCLSSWRGVSKERSHTLQVNSSSSLERCLLGCPTLHLFFELSLVLLTTKALGLYEFTKKFQRYRPKIEVQGKIFVFALFTREKCLLAKSAHFRTKKNGTSSGQIKILRPLL